jgi:hypothetical protein
MKRAALVLVALALLLICVGRADAGNISITDDAFGTYQISFPGGVSVAYNDTAGTYPDPPKASFNGTLTIDASFSSNNPITITFTQTSVQNVTNFGLASGGLRLALDTLMANQTSVAWVGFTYTLQDNTNLKNVNLGNQGTHLGIAHFHPESNPSGENPMYTTTVFSVIQGVDNTPSISLGKGKLDPNGEFSLTNALLHERNYMDNDGKPVLRTFDLILTPTPNP